MCGVWGHCDIVIMLTVNYRMRSIIIIIIVDETISNHSQDEQGFGLAVESLVHAFMAGAGSICP